MATFNRVCPICGHLNMNLYLDDTDGWMECEKCRNITKDTKDQKGKKVRGLLFNDQTLEFDTEPVLASIV